MEESSENGPTEKPKPEGTSPSLRRQPCRRRIQWNKQWKRKHLMSKDKYMIALLSIL